MNFRENYDYSSIYNNYDESIFTSNQNTNNSINSLIYDINTNNRVNNVFDTNITRENQPLPQTDQQSNQRTFTQLSAQPLSSSQHSTVEELMLKCNFLSQQINDCQQQIANFRQQINDQNKIISSQQDIIKQQNALVSQMMKIANPIRSTISDLTPSGQLRGFPIPQQFEYSTGFPIPQQFEYSTGFPNSMQINPLPMPPKPVPQQLLEHTKNFPNSTGQIGLPETSMPSQPQLQSQFVQQQVRQSTDSQLLESLAPARPLPSSLFPQNSQRSINITNDREQEGNKEEHEVPNKNNFENENSHQDDLFSRISFNNEFEQSAHSNQNYLNDNFANEHQMTHMHITQSEMFMKKNFEIGEQIEDIQKTLQKTAEKFKETQTRLSISPQFSYIQELEKNKEKCAETEKCKEDTTTSVEQNDSKIQNNKEKNVNIEEECSQLIEKIKRRMQKSIDKIEKHGLLNKKLSNKKSNELKKNERCLDYLNQILFEKETINGLPVRSLSLIYKKYKTYIFKYPKAHRKFLEAAMQIESSKQLLPSKALQTLINTILTDISSKDTHSMESLNLSEKQKQLREELEKQNNQIIQNNPTYLKIIEEVKKTMKEEMTELIKQNPQAKCTKAVSTALAIDSSKRKMSEVVTHNEEISSPISEKRDVTDGVSQSTEFVTKEVDMARIQKKWQSRKDYLARSQRKELDQIRQLLCNQISNSQNTLNLRSLEGLTKYHSIPTSIFMSEADRKLIDGNRIHQHGEALCAFKEKLKYRNTNNKNDIDENKKDKENRSITQTQQPAKPRKKHSFPKNKKSKAKSENMSSTQTQQPAKSRKRLLENLPEGNNDNVEHSLSKNKKRKLNPIDLNK